VQNGVAQRGFGESSTFQLGIQPSDDSMQLLVGRAAALPVLGLVGRPVSAATLFLPPLLQGIDATHERFVIEGGLVYYRLLDADGDRVDDLDGHLAAGRSEHRAKRRPTRNPPVPRAHDRPPGTRPQHARRPRKPL
jgi:hypothetical protein